MAFMNIVLYAYAAIVLVGGIAGYLSAKSLPSLIASIPSAVLCAAAAYLSPTHHIIGLGLGLAISGLLATFFVYRLKKTGKKMPAIPMIILSDGVAIACAYFLVRLSSAAH